MRKMLLKLVSDEKYADDLLDGKLFTRPARYYHDLERRLSEAQRDESEAIIFPGIALYKNAEKPIYCMMLVPDEDYTSKGLRITKEVVEEFCAEYLVAVEYERFISAMKPHLANCPYAINAGPVVYGQPDHECSAFLMCDDNAANLFIKRKHFSDQHEYRVVIFENINDEYKIYRLQNEIRSFARKYAVNNLPYQDGFYFIDYKF